MGRPNPKELVGVVLTEKNVNQYKSFDCVHYEKCLDKAQKWEQFHCKRCKAYEPDPEMDDDLTALLKALLVPAK